MENLWGLPVIALGGVLIAGGILNWDWFMESRQARIFVSTLGRLGARGFYVLLGAVIVTFGILGLLGIIDVFK